MSGDGWVFLLVFIIVDLQYCVSFKHTVRRFTYTCICMLCISYEVGDRWAPAWTFTISQSPLSIS